jgi:hypothetical protein
VLQYWDFAFFLPPDSHKMEVNVLGSKRPRSRHHERNDKNENDIMQLTERLNKAMLASYRYLGVLDVITILGRINEDQAVFTGKYRR